MDEAKTELNPVIASTPSGGSASWRLLEIGDKIEIGDQYLEYDCQTWKAISVHEWCIGDNYSNVFVPMRRMIQNE